MSQREIFEFFQNYLKDMGGDFCIMEHQVPVETQMEYFKYSNQLRSQLPAAKEIDFEQFNLELYNPESTIESKRKTLSTLAISKQTKGYRIIEKYLQTPDKDLADWAHMALMESRVALETELSDEKQIYISTGLGGKGNKLRFFVLLLASSGEPFLDYQRKVIEREFAYYFLQHDGEIEQLTIKSNYAALLVLIPIHSDIQRIIKKVIDECNQYGNFLSNLVTVTNVKKLTEKEIAQIIKKNENIRTSS